MRGARLRESRCDNMCREWAPVLCYCIGVPMDAGDMQEKLRRACKAAPKAHSAVAASVSHMAPARWPPPCRPDSIVPVARPCWRYRLAQSSSYCSAPTRPFIAGRGDGALLQPSAATDDKRPTDTAQSSAATAELEKSEPLTMTMMSLYCLLFSFVAVGGNVVFSYLAHLAVTACLISCIARLRHSMVTITTVASARELLFCGRRFLGCGLS